MRATSRLLSAGLTWLALLSAPTVRADEPKPTLKDLAKVYDELGLPHPPKDAKLVRHKAGGGSIINGVVQPETASVVFEIAAKDKDHPRGLNIGLNYLYPLDPNEKTIEVQPTKKALDGTTPWGSELVMAIQCWSRGWTELAQAIYERTQKAEHEPPLKELYSEAWNYWDDTSFATRNQTVPRSPGA